MRSLRATVAICLLSAPLLVASHAFGETVSPADVMPSPDAGLPPAPGQQHPATEQAPPNAPAAPPAEAPQVKGAPPAGAEAAPLPPTDAAEGEKRKGGKHKDRKHKKRKQDDQNQEDQNQEDQNQGDRNQEERAKRNRDTDSIPGDPWGDTPGAMEAGPITFRVLLQTRYTSTFAAASMNTRPTYAEGENILVRQGDGWSLNRFFLRVGAEPTRFVSFRAILDFAQLMQGGVGGTVKQAYGTLRPLPKHLEFVAGLFKLPFSILELDPIAKYELADLGAADDLTKDLGFAGRDVGAAVMVAPLPKPKHLRLWLGVFRGHSKDENDSLFGAVGGRIESKPVKGLRLGVDAVALPYSVTYARPFDTSNRDVNNADPDPLHPRHLDWAEGRAWSADVTFERWRLMLRGEGMMGNRVDMLMRYGARTFWAAWALAAYRFRTGPIQLMPAARVEWLDADREHNVGLRRSLGFGLNVIFSKEARFLFDVTRTDVQGGSPILNQPLPVSQFPYFELSHTRLVGQLQVQI